jgi:hypothetical protein
MPDDAVEARDLEGRVAVGNPLCVPDDLTERPGEVLDPAGLGFT